MSKQLKFLQLSTILRAGIDPDRIPMERFDKLLAPRADAAREELIRSVLAVIAGEVKINFVVEKVTFRNKVFKPKRRK